MRAPESFVDLAADDARTVRYDEVLGGRVFVLRDSLRRLGLQDLVVERALEGIRKSVGAAAADEVSEKGFERVHEVVGPDLVPKMTDAVYDEFEMVAGQMLDRYVPTLFGFDGTYYYERTPNVRFHYPFDLVRSHAAQFTKFAATHGEGKISAHGPHRDYWLDCPDNAFNIWIAVGRVREGNGLSVFVDEYTTDLECIDGGNLRMDAPLSPPLNFDLARGDAVVFHANHLHGSELNRTNETRFVVSFRLALARPHFPRGHHHEYLHSDLARGGGVGRALASVPAYLQSSYAMDRARRLAAKVLGRSGGGERARSNGANGVDDQRLSAKGEVSLAVDDVAVGSVVAIARDAVVARLTEDRFVALSRICPHQAADLACGFATEDGVVCAYHNLAFDGATGASACAELPRLKVFPCEVRGSRVIVGAAGVEADSARSDD